MSERQPETTRWQPMHTAPRDGHGHHAGRDVDLWHKRQGRLANCFWDDNLQAWMARSGGAAFNMGGDDCFTHWMPLPEAPRALADEVMKS